MIKNFLLVIFFVTSSLILDADESVFFGEEEYCKRTQQYSIGNYKEIVVVSPYRTGSTLIYNALKFLFNDPDSLHRYSIVGKSHAVNNLNPEKLIFLLIRNPIDTCFSRYRVMGARKNQIINETALDTAVAQYLVQTKRMHDLFQMKLPNVVLLKYEDFVPSLKGFFDAVESTFNIKISEFDKNLIEKVFSKKNIGSLVEKYENFSRHDLVTGFHGKHIDNGDEFSEKEKLVIRKKIKQRLLGKCDFLKEYGYIL